MADSIISPKLVKLRRKDGAQGCSASAEVVALPRVLFAPSGVGAAEPGVEAPREVAEAFGEAGVVTVAQLDGDVEVEAVLEDHSGEGGAEGVDKPAAVND